MFEAVRPQSDLLASKRSPLFACHASAALSLEPTDRLLCVAISFLYLACFPGLPALPALPSSRAPLDMMTCIAVDCCILCSSASINAMEEESASMAIANVTQVGNTLIGRLYDDADAADVLERAHMYAKTFACLLARLPARLPA